METALLIVLQTVPIVVLAIAIWPLVVFARRGSGSWQRMLYWSVGVFLLVFAFVSTEFRFVPLLLACLACSVALRPVRKV